MALTLLKVPATVTYSPPPASLRYNELDTEQLITLAQQDDLKALEQLIQRHQRLVYMTLHQLAPERDDISDLTQDVLLKMCRSLKTLRSPKTFKVWLNRIITNRFYDELRKQPRKLRTVSMDEPRFNDEDSGENQLTQDIADISEMPHISIDQAELDSEIQKAIEALPEQFRTIIVLRELQGLSYDEIAAILDTNLGTVKSRLARARLRLQSLLTPYLKGQDV